MYRETSEPCGVSALQALASPPSRCAPLSAPSAQQRLAAAINHAAVWQAYLLLGDIKEELSFHDGDGNQETACIAQLITAMQQAGADLPQKMDYERCSCLPLSVRLAAAASAPLAASPAPAARLPHAAAIAASQRRNPFTEGTLKDSSKTHRPSCPF